MNTKTKAPSILPFYVASAERPWNPLKAYASADLPEKVWVARCLPGNLRGYGPSSMESKMALRLLWRRALDKASQRPGGVRAWWREQMAALTDADRKAYHEQLQKSVDEGGVPMFSAMNLPWPDGDEPDWFPYVEQGYADEVTTGEVQHI